MSKDEKDIYDEYLKIVHEVSKEYIKDYPDKKHMFTAVCVIAGAPSSIFLYTQNSLLFYREHLIDLLNFALLDNLDEIEKPTDFERFCYLAAICKTIVKDEKENNETTIPQIIQQFTFVLFKEIFLKISGRIKVSAGPLPAKPVFDPEIEQAYQQFCQNVDKLVFEVNPFRSDIKNKLLQAEALIAAEEDGKIITSMIGNT